MSSDATGRLAKFLVGLQYDDIPQSACIAAKSEHIVDYLVDYPNSFPE